MLKTKMFLDKDTSLFEFQNKYYICFKNIKCSITQMKQFCSAISEFGTFVEYSSLYSSKLVEYGTKIVSKNVINTLSKKF